MVKDIYLEPDNQLVLLQHGDEIVLVAVDLLEVVGDNDSSLEPD